MRRRAAFDGYHVDLRGSSVPLQTACDCANVLTRVPGRRDVWVLRRVDDVRVGDVKVVRASEWPHGTVLVNTQRKKEDTNAGTYVIRGLENRAEVLAEHELARVVPRDADAE